jgi:hypothetical protein
MDPKPPIRKQIHVKVGLMQTVKHTDALCINIRNAIERCDERIGGVELTVVDVPMPVVFTGASFERG